MPWWAEQGGSPSGTLRKSASKPGPNWVEIPGATDAMTEQQAAQVLVHDVASGVFGSSVANGLGKAAGAVPGVDQARSVTQFLGQLSDRNTWIRVAKVVIGGALLIIGLAHMTGASNAVAAAARKVPVPV